MSSASIDNLMDHLATSKELPITSIDPNAVTELAEIRIDRDMDPVQRVKALIKQTGNPYVYRDGGVIVKVSFANNGKTLQSCLEDYISAEILMHR